MYNFPDAIPFLNCFNTLFISEFMIYNISKEICSYMYLHYHLMVSYVDMQV